MAGTSEHGECRTSIRANLTGRGSLGPLVCSRQCWSQGSKRVSGGTCSREPSVSLAAIEATHGALPRTWACRLGLLFVRDGAGARTPCAAAPVQESPSVSLAAIEAALGALPSSVARGRMLVTWECGWWPTKGSCSLVLMLVNCSWRKHSDRRGLPSPPAQLAQFAQLAQLADGGRSPGR